jgi:hypothetical protein
MDSPVITALAKKVDASKIDQRLSKKSTTTLRFCYDVLFEKGTSFIIESDPYPNILASFGPLPKVPRLLAFIQMRTCTTLNRREMTFRSWML